jgi:hypothetical protein
VRAGTRKHPIAGAEIAQVAVGHRAHAAVDAREGSPHAERTAMQRGLHLPSAVRDLSDVVGLEANAALGRSAPQLRIDGDGDALDQPRRALIEARRLQREHVACVQLDAALDAGLHFRVETRPHTHRRGRLAPSAAHRGRRRPDALAERAAQLQLERPDRAHEGRAEEWQHGIAVVAREGVVALDTKSAGKEQRVAPRGARLRNHPVLWFHALETPSTAVG